MKFSLIGALTFCVGLAALSCKENKISTTTDTIPELKKLVDRVDPFIGTGGHGHTYPGATLPFGMVQLSPDTRLEGWDGCSGYHYSDSIIYGFSHTHLQGTGVSDYGDILFMPTNHKTSTADQWKDAYKSSFSHKNESASPGYYAVHLDQYNVDVELTTTERTGIHQYHFAPGDSCRLFIDMMHRDDLVRYDIQTIGDTVIYGYRISKAWAVEQHCYFYARFSKPFHNFRQLDVSSVATGSDGVRREILEEVQVFSVDFDPTDEITIKVGISGTDAYGAQHNLWSEAPHWDFEKYKTDASQKWDTQLAKIKVEEGSEEDQKCFYTALYHCFTTPNLWSDVDHRFRGMDNQIHTAEGYDRYSVFSLWDTFRSLHPLFTYVERQRTADFIKTFLDMYKETGYLPVWELAGNETECMIGYHSASVITDAYVNGITDFDKTLALKAMMASSMGPGKDKQLYDSLGYVPADMFSESVSKTLEYAYDDWCIAQFARKTGNPDIYQKYILRAQNWKNLYDPETGFMRARKNGGFVDPFDPFEVNFHYTEANAWQYSFFVPHDIKTLIEYSGGDSAFIVKLDRLFSASTSTTGREQADITGLIGQYAHGNEPSHHMAYLYTDAGRPDLASRKVYQIMNEQYRPNPDGLSGNEDCGQMSAWLVLSRLGLYRVTPGIQHQYYPNDFSWKYTAADPSVFPGGDQNPLEIEPEHYTTDIVDHQITPVPIVMGPQTSFSSFSTVRIYCALKEAVIKVELTEENESKKTFIYSKPFSITKSCTIRAWAEATGNLKSKVVNAQYIKRQDNRKIRSISAYDNQYSAGGNDALVDGLRGSEDFRTGCWQGFQGKNIEVVVDMGQKQEISHAGISCYQDINPWIWFPSSVEFAVSKDGINFKPVGVVKNDVPITDKEISTHEFVLDFEKVEARYVRIIAIPAFDVIPQWHLGSGGKPWIFADEIIVR